MIYELQSAERVDDVRDSDVELAVTAMMVLSWRQLRDRLTDRHRLILFYREYRGAVPLPLGDYLR